MLRKIKGFSYLLVYSAVPGHLEAKLFIVVHVSKNNSHLRDGHRKPEKTPVGY